MSEVIPMKASLVNLAFCDFVRIPLFPPFRSKVGGVATQKNKKKPKKTEKKNSPKFEICGSVRFFRFFSAFFGFFRYLSVLCGTFLVFFGLNFDKKFQSFKNHVNNEVLGGQELPNKILNAYKALQMSYKSYY